MVRETRGERLAMDEMVKIPDSDYAKLEENARKVLETLRPEAVSE